MQKKWLAVALVSALVCSAATAVQAEVKIGVVSTEVILRDSAAAQAASKKLEQEFSKRDKELNAAGQRLKNDVERFEKNAGTMTEQERIRKQRDLAEETAISSVVSANSAKTSISAEMKSSRSFFVRLIRSSRTSLSAKSMTSFFRRPSTSTRRLISLIRFSRNSSNFYRAQADRMSACCLIAI